MEQAKQSRFIWYTGIVMFVFVILIFAIVAIVQPFRLERYFKPIVVIHIALAMSWLLFFVYQSRLVVRGKIGRHQKNLYVGILTVPIIVINALYITYDWGEAQRLVGESRDVLVFAILFFVSIRAAIKGNFATHKRQMLIACLNLINPAFIRISYILDLSTLILVLLSLLSCVIIPIAYDLVTIGKIHRATLGGLSFTIITYALMIAIVFSPLMEHIESILY
jgi:hypothetical protein